MDINGFIELISNQGISVFLVVFYVLKQQKTTEKNTEVLVELTTLIKEMYKREDDK